MNALKLKPDFRIKLLLFGIALLILMLHAWHYLPFIADDALISLRYSQRFIQGCGLTWNTNERVEGYSNLLWVLSVAGLGLLRIDLIDAVRILGFLGMAAAIAAVFCGAQTKTWKAWLFVFLVVMFLPLSAPFAAWTVGGMEQPMVAGLLAWAVVLCYSRLEEVGPSARRLLAPSLLFGLLCLTRLDGALFTAAAVVAILIVDRATPQAWRKAIGLATLPILFVLVQIIFRLAYYGEWVPNTALVKLSPSGKHANDGWNYLLAGAFPILPLLLVAALSIVISFRQRFREPRMILLCVLAGSWTAYVAVIGGDILPAWRHFVPLLALLVLMAAVGAEWAAEYIKGTGSALIVLTLPLLLGAFFWLQSRDEENFRAISERWEWDGKAVGVLLKQAFGTQQPLMAVDPAGCLPYWSELPTIDMLGLNDYYLPRHPPPNMGEGAIGHELGDGQYVLNRRPDLVVFLLPTGNDRGYFLSGRQMQEDPRFFREYSLTRFESSEPHKVVSRVWVRNESERIGIKRFDGLITIPAFLLNGKPETVARLGISGQLIVPVSRHMPAQIKKLTLPPGRWRIELEASQPELRIKAFASGDTGRVLLDSQAPAMMDWKGSPEDTIDLEVLSDSDSIVEVRQLRLTRLPD
jgi:arabinofuranosyltransferase